MIYILEKYEKASRQVLSKEKTSIFFSKNTHLEVNHNFTTIVGVRAIGSFEKYLGFLAIVGKAKTRSFQALINRTWNRISN